MSYNVFSALYRSDECCFTGTEYIILSGATMPKLVMINVDCVTRTFNV